MSNLTHLFKVNQKVKCKLDGKFYNGTVKETYADHIIIDVPEISDHCYFEEGFNMDCVYPEYNFEEWYDEIYSRDYAFYKSLWICNAQRRKEKEVRVA